MSSKKCGHSVIKKKIKFSQKTIGLLHCCQYVHSKILEKVVKVRVIEFFNKHNFFSKNQYRFQSGLNTGSAVIDFMSQAYIGIHESKVCAGTFVDVMKALDAVDHDILLHRMNVAGTRGVAQDWVCSYLTGRTQNN